MLELAFNDFDRTGRRLFRVTPHAPHIELIAANDLIDASTLVSTNFDWNLPSSTFDAMSAAMAGGDNAEFEDYEEKAGKKEDG